MDHIMVEHGRGVFTSIANIPISRVGHMDHDLGDPACGIHLGASQVGRHCGCRPRKCLSEGVAGRG
ncbi:hypothetical protein BDW71DRAFT_192397 [Aspergillus fruticulosus]